MSGHGICQGMNGIWIHNVIVCGPNHLNAETFIIESYTLTQSLSDIIFKSYWPAG